MTSARAPLDRAPKRRGEGSEAVAEALGQARRVLRSTQPSPKVDTEPIEIDLGQPGASTLSFMARDRPVSLHDLVFAPRIGGYVYWECPWPAAADQAGVDHAVVHVTVDVTARGEPQRPT